MKIKPSTSLRKEILDLREKLRDAEIDKINGAKTYSIDEASEILRGLIDGLS
ncbi:hypothetical protein [Tissierella sp.]|uniref:hypothetical protein n=1 Tax=Tissierella sp. TaxID=41274 RepID=UPI0028673F07|nr:hypothetical protein [Tissierella sp.]MDR7856660.1 hypothetical protein [Tissierella sp.]